MGRLPSVAAVAGSYLAGAFPTAELVTAAVGRDVHREGSGNPGATNTYRIAGAPAAALVATVDVAKGAVATWAGQRLGSWPRPHSRAGAISALGRAGPRHPLGPACGVAAVVGHCFPPTKKGGKGVATAAGMLAALDPPLAVLAAVTWGGLAKATRRPSLASVVTAAGLPLAAAALRRPWAEQVAVAAAGAVIVARHRDNIARLRRGKEPPLPS